MLYSEMSLEQLHFEHARLWNEGVALEQAASDGHAYDGPEPGPDDVLPQFSADEIIGAQLSAVIRELRRRGVVMQNEVPIYPAADLIV